MDERIVVDASGPVASLVFNNPERRNAVSLEMWLRVTEELQRLASLDELRVLVISGAGGRAFVSGADISRFEAERSTPEAVDRYNAAAAAAYDAIESFPRPTIARITGACVGGGVNVAVCCDLRVCDDAARFGVTAAKLGVGYGYQAVRRLAAVVGVAHATDLLLTGRLVGADEAQAMGLVHRVTTDVDRTVTELATTVAGNAPLTVSALKRIAKAVADPARPVDHEALDALVAACFSSEDYVEGRRAFLEKRPPRFSGR